MNVFTVRPREPTLRAESHQIVGAALARLREDVKQGVRQRDMKTHKHTHR